MKTLAELKKDIADAHDTITSTPGNIDAIAAYTAYAVATAAYAEDLAIAAKAAEAEAKAANAELIAFVSGPLQYINLCRRSGSVKMKTVLELKTLRRKTNVN